MDPYSFYGLVLLSIIFGLYFFKPLKKNKISIEMELILFDCPITKFPEKYSEGVFAWVENGEIRSTPKYHTTKGGDPEVFEQWLILNQNTVSRKKVQ